MINLIRYGHFLAEVDVSDLENVTYSLTMCQTYKTPLADECGGNVYAEDDMAREIKMLRQEIDEYVRHERRRRMRGTAYAV